MRGAPFATRVVFRRAWRQNRRPQGPHGEGGGSGGEQLENKRKKGVRQKQDGFEGRGKEEAVEKRILLVSDASNMARMQQHGKGGGAEEKL